MASADNHRPHRWRPVRIPGVVIHIPAPPPIVVHVPPPPPIVVQAPPPIVVQAPPPVVVQAPPPVVVEAPPPVVVNDVNVAAVETSTVVAEQTVVWSGGGGGDGIDPLAVAHWEAGISMLVATDFGVDEPSFGATLGGQLGPVRLGMDYMRYERDLGMGSVSASRLGLTARYRVSMNAGDAGFGLYVEAGAGREARTYGPGMHEAVGTALVGAGMEVLIGNHKSAGFDIGFRGIVDADDQMVGLVQLSALVGSR